MTAMKFVNRHGLNLINPSRSHKPGGIVGRQFRRSSTAGCWKAVDASASSPEMVASRRDHRETQYFRPPGSSLCHAEADTRRRYPSGTLSPELAIRHAVDNASQVPIVWESMKFRMRVHLRCRRSAVARCPNFKQLCTKREVRAGRLFGNDSDRHCSRCE